MYEYQILANLERMSCTQLLNLSFETTSTETFITNAKATSREKGLYLQHCSQKIECSVRELLALLHDNALISSPLPSDTPEVAQAKKGMHNTYTLTLFLALCMLACLLLLFYYSYMF